MRSKRMAATVRAPVAALMGKMIRRKQIPERRQENACTETLPPVMALEKTRHRNCTDRPGRNVDLNNWLWRAKIGGKVEGKCGIQKEKRTIESRSESLLQTGRAGGPPSVTVKRNRVRGDSDADETVRRNQRCAEVV
jgi:hypothetical protein